MNFTPTTTRRLIFRDSLNKMTIYDKNAAYTPYYGLMNYAHNIKSWLMGRAALACNQKKYLYALFDCMIFLPARPYPPNFEWCFAVGKAFGLFFALFNFLCPKRRRPCPVRALFGRRLPKLQPVPSLRSARPCAGCLPPSMTPSGALKMRLIRIFEVYAKSIFVCFIF